MKPEKPFWLGDKSQLIILISWAALMLVTILAYLPGLSGPFLLDDFGSIRALGDYGGVTDWESFKVFVFGGNSGPTGRPLSLLTFLIDANNWPTDAWPFKRTNLVIHLISGVVLGQLARSILKTLEYERNEANWLAFATAAIWLLHPFLVSTTMYAVQRMAQLSTLFMFAGLAFYLYGRSFLTSYPLKAYSIMSVAIGGFTLLAMLSKENGILLPLLAGVIEITIFASQRHRLPGLNRYWGATFIVLPAIVIGRYLVKHFFSPTFYEIVPPRDFSIYERLLTQGRVLIEYLQHWYLPKLYTTGVFQDHFIKSTSLLAPVTTLLSILFHVAVISMALVKRRQWPLFALAVLFFYVGHLLESTVVNLEMYFEHRNYLPAAFLFLPFIAVLRAKVSARTFGVALIGVLLLLGSFTRYSATVWQSLPSMIESSALKAPTSSRAQSQYAKLLFYKGRKAEALAVVERAIENIPGDRPLLLTTRLYFLCSQNQLDAGDFKQVADKLSAMDFDSRSLKAYNVFAQEVVTGKCPNIPADQLETMFLRMLAHPANSNPKSLQYAHVNFLIGYSRIYGNNPTGALDAFQKSLNSRPGSSHSMSMAALLASNGFNREALVLADRALVNLRKEMAEGGELAQRVKESDILAFQETVRADLAMQSGPGTSDPSD
jgi:hypothetical protein